MQRVSHPCPEPGCPHLISKHNSCPAHRNDRNQVAGAKRYPRQWTAFAQAWLATHPLCGHCGGRAKQVHHLVSVRVAPHRRLDPTNVVALCPSCHMRVHVTLRPTYHQNRRRTR